MADIAAPNLPSRNLAATSAFYAALGFVKGWRDEQWMILTRDGATLKFFPTPELNPLTSRFSWCVRLDDLDSSYSIAVEAGVPETCRGQPRLHPATVEDAGTRIAYLVDPDGILLRLIQN